MLTSDQSGAIIHQPLRLSVRTINRYGYHTQGYKDLSSLVASSCASRSSALVAGRLKQACSHLQQVIVVSSLAQ
eukprot:m.92815 g.92815  ORF g.92815 m.92815 type:complete len:74 (+) comp14965_c0_seq5:739-960(+)